MGPKPGSKAGASRLARRKHPGAKKRLGSRGIQGSRVSMSRAASEPPNYDADGPSSATPSPDREGLVPPDADAQSQSRSEDSGEELVGLQAEKLQDILQVVKGYVDQAMKEGFQELIDRIPEAPSGVTASSKGTDVAGQGDLRSIASHHVPLDAHISDNVKEKIWSDIYIDVKSLLPSEGHQQEVVILQQGVLTVGKEKSSRGITNFEEWLRAMNIFFSIYLQRFPEEGSNIFKYLDSIRELKNNSQWLAWKTYDEEFRKLRAVAQSPWQVVNLELWVRCSSRRYPQPQPWQGRQQPSRPFGRNFSSSLPKEYCWAFLRSGFCIKEKSGQCRFKHMCYRCGQRHQVSQCNQSTLRHDGDANPNKTKRPAVSAK